MFRKDSTELVWSRTYWKLHHKPKPEMDQKFVETDLKIIENRPTNWKFITFSENWKKPKIRESDLKIEETDQKKWKIPQKKSVEGFPNIFEKQETPQKILFWGSFLFLVRFCVEAFP